MTSTGHFLLMSEVWKLIHCDPAGSSLDATQCRGVRGVRDIDKGQTVIVLYTSLVPQENSIK